MRTTLLLLPLLLAACSSEDSTLSEAALQLRVGDLDRAGALLEGLDGARAERMRKQILERREVRAGLDAELAAIYAEHAQDPLRDLQAALRARSNGEPDPVVRERLATVMSRAADDRAEEIARVGHALAEWTTTTGEQVPDEDETSPFSSPRDAILDQVVAQVRHARESQSWSEADGLLRMALEDAPSYSARLAPLRRTLETEADIQGRDLLRRVAKLEQGGRVAEARALLVREAWRYPDRGDCAAIHRRVEELHITQVVKREERPRAAPKVTDVRKAHTPPKATPQPDPAADVVGLDSIELAVAAVQAEGRDQFESASELWALAAEAATIDRERARYELRGFSARARHDLRVSLAAAYREDEDVFFGAGVGLLEVGGMTIGGEPVAWMDLAPSTLAKLVEAVELSSRDRVGLALEKLAREDAHGRSGGLADLKRAFVEGTIDQRTTWHLVASYRREAVPAGGYEWRGGQWISSLDLDLEVLGEELDALAATLARGDLDERDEAFAALAVHARASEAGRLTLDTALRERFVRAAASIEKGSTLQQLAAVAGMRTELDRRREHALDLIYDTVTYFYPYNPPDPTSGKTIGDYYEAQREVDVRVNEVRDLWERTVPAVSLPRGFKDALADLDWIRGQHGHLRGPLLLQEDWPEWLDGIDTSVERISVSTFAWDARERAQKARGRLVRSWNEERWESSDALETAEKNQVRITNAYRQMFGRRALAWNGKIQEAAQWHSDYMANTGNFGHTEPEDPANRTPFDRMRRVGYLRGASENCHRGSGDPQGAHTGWCHSSGHHRNLLQAGHAEMASGLAAGNWTQNFGNGTDFETELEAWRN
jgi:hypothetical protein